MNKNQWLHTKTIVDGETYLLQGINIWDYPWNNTGERIQVKDPLYGQDYTFSVYEISQDQKKVKFAAGEFSNCVWGIFEKNE